jgi:hypothetical protein
MLWISWLFVYKSLFFTTNNDTKSIYCECKGRFSNLLYNCLQESLLLDFVIIRITRLLILKICAVSFPRKLYHMSLSLYISEACDSDHARCCLPDTLLCRQVFYYSLRLCAQRKVNNNGAQLAACHLDDLRVCLTRSLLRDFPTVCSLVLKENMNNYLGHYKEWSYSSMHI